ncbi:MAG TPA: hypothetical protein VIG24_17270, partial [Acidimicrobiia bacterium]
EGGGSFADQGVRIPGRDGVDLDDRAPFGAMLLPLKKVLRYTNDAGAVTHANGAAGHVKLNLSEIKKRYNRGAVFLRRTDPDVGRQRALVKAMTDPMPGGRRERFVYRWVLMCASGSWQDNTATTQAAGSLSTSGDKRIFDPVVSIGAAGTLIYTSAIDGTTYTITAASGPTFPVTVDVGAGTVVDDADVDASGAVTFDPGTPWLMLDPDSTTAITGTAAATSSVTYRNRWG